MKNLLFLSIFLRALSAFGQNETEKQIFLADPTILEDAGTYYLYGTVEGDASNGFKAFRSSDLKNWTDLGYVLKKGESFGDKGFWAPQVLRYKQRYLIAYVANEEIAIAYADKPEGPFRQEKLQAIPGPVKQIDPFIFIDDDGKIYLYHVRLDQGNKIFAGQMKADLSGLVDETVTECIQALEPWENTANSKWPVAEGPSVLKQRGQYYLFYTANDFRNPDYAVGYAVSDSPLGPWKKYVGNPIISRKNVGFNGTGHGDFFFDKRKNLTYVMHTHNGPAMVGKRKTALIRINTTQTATGQKVFLPDLSTFRFLETKQ